MGVHFAAIHFELLHFGIAEQITIWAENMELLKNNSQTITPDPPIERKEDNMK
ncbi:MAG: hypothetical protein WC389_10370 [Lutibacter sp.]|jgi:hypothetical protein